MSILDGLLNKFIKSDYVKAQVLAQARHIATGFGVWLVTKGLADHAMSEDLVGFVMAATSFYLANLDVKVVDGKIKVALETPPPSAPVTPVTVQPLPPI